MPVFDWPPPQPTTMTRIPKPFYLAGVPDSERTHFEVAQRLEKALIAAGYRAFSTYGVGCNGFAIVTSIEPIDNSGRRIEGVSWRANAADESWSPTAYLKRLFYAPPGRFRQFIFVASDQDLVRYGDAMTASQLDVLSERGKDGLAPELFSVPFSARFSLKAFIYEFEKTEPDEDAKLILPERNLDGEDHLEGAGVYAGLLSAQSE